MSDLYLIQRFFSFWYTVRIGKIERLGRLADQADMNEIAYDMVAYLHKKGLTPPPSSFYIDEYPHKIPVNRVLH